MQRDYERVVEVLRTGTTAQLDALAREIDGFPTGIDPVVGEPWIVAAVGCGSCEAVDWVLRMGAPVAFRGDDGYTPLHLALQREGPDRYRMLELLLTKGAPINLKGINDWTPAHMAAALDDVEALRILVRHGADLTIRTDIDDYATPLEEARNLGKLRAAAFLESVA